MVQTCDNLMELDLDYMVGVEEVQISAGCFDVAATECVRAFSWSTITFPSVLFSVHDIALTPS